MPGDLGVHYFQTKRLVGGFVNLLFSSVFVNPDLGLLAFSCWLVRKDILICYNPWFPDIFPVNAYGSNRLLVAKKRKYVG